MPAFENTKISTFPDDFVDSPLVPNPLNSGLATIIGETQEPTPGPATFFSTTPDLIGVGSREVTSMAMNTAQSSAMSIPHMGTDTVLGAAETGSGQFESDSGTGCVKSYTTGASVYSGSVFGDLLDGLVEEEREPACPHGGHEGNSSGCRKCLVQSRAERISLVPLVPLGDQGNMDDKAKKRSKPRRMWGDTEPYPYPRNNRRFPGSGSTAVSVRGTGEDRG
ncbi:hypothetical protein VTI74DRAFT_5890 [Chaetomium olivicolor]